MNIFPHFQNYLLAFSVLFFSAINVYAEDKNTIASITEEVVLAMRKSYNDLGSFKAEYDLSGKNKQAKLQLIQNTKKKFVAVLLDDDKGDTPPKLFLAIYREDPLKGKAIQLIVGKPPEFQKMDVSVWNVVENPLSPLTALLTITNALEEKDPRLTDELDLKNFYPSTSLGLTLEELVIGIGITQSSAGPSAMWLDQQWYKDAEKIEREADTVRVAFPDGHEVLLDLKSGLLKKDHWPWDPMLSNRHLTLIKYGPLDPAFDIEDLMPGYSEMTFKPIPATHMNMQVLQVTLLSLNVLLSSMPNLKEIIEQDSAAIENRIRSAAGPETRKEAKALLADFPQAYSILQSFHLLHKQYQKDHPKAQVDFDEFMENWLGVMTENPDANPMNKIVLGIENNYSKIIHSLPLEETAPIHILYDRFSDVYLDGWRNEITRAFINKVLEAEKAPKQ